MVRLLTNGKKPTVSEVKNIKNKGGGITILLIYITSRDFKGFKVGNRHYQLITNLTNLTTRFYKHRQPLHITNFVYTYLPQPI